MGMLLPQGRVTAHSEGRGETCLLRRDICINQGPFAPWGIAWDQTFPINLPICGHDPQANELLSLTRHVSHGGYGRVTPKPA